MRILNRLVRFRFVFPPSSGVLLWAVLLGCGAVSYIPEAVSAAEGVNAAQVLFTAASPGWGMAARNVVIENQQDLDDWLKPGGWIDDIYRLHVNGAQEFFRNALSGRKIDFDRERVVIVTASVSVVAEGVWKGVTWDEEEECVEINFFCDLKRGGGFSLPAVSNFSAVYVLPKSRAPVRLRESVLRDAGESIGVVDVPVFDREALLSGVAGIKYVKISLREPLEVPLNRYTGAVNITVVAPEDGDLSALSDLPKQLISLTITDAKAVTDLSPIRTSQNLRYLTVSGGMDKADLSTLLAFPSLADLRLKGTVIRDVTVLAKIKALKKLLVHRLECDHPGALVGETSLAELHIGDHTVGQAWFDGVRGELPGVVLWQRDKPDPNSPDFITYSQR